MEIGKLGGAADWRLAALAVEAEGAVEKLTRFRIITSSIVKKVICMRIPDQRDRGFRSSVTEVSERS
jgi:hypothetical protein